MVGEQGELKISRLANGRGGYSTRLFMLASFCGKRVFIGHFMLKSGKDVGKK